jgi:hypothetical protein
MPKSYQLGNDMAGVNRESTNTVTQCVERFASINSFLAWSLLCATDLIYEKLYVKKHFTQTT